MRPVGLSLALAILAGACLSTPPQAGRDGGDAGGDDDDDDHDAGSRDGGDASGPVADAAVAAGGPCSPRTSFPGASLPTAGIGIRHAITADVNGDGDDDLLLTNADGGPASWGVYVLLGPQPDPAALVYHAFVATSVSPDGLAVRDVIRDTGGVVCPELVVLGTSQGGVGHVEVHRFAAGDPDMYDLGVDRPLDFAPAHNGPVIVAFADLLGDGADDLVVADLASMRVLYTGGDVGANLETAAAIPLGPTGSAGGVWTSINAVYAVPRPGVADRDDLVVVENFGMTWLHHDGDSAYTVGEQVANGGAFVSRGLLRHDLDGVPPDDIVSIGGDKLGAYLLEDDGAALGITQVGWAAALPDVLGGGVDGVAVGDLGGSALPELAIVDAPQGAGTSKVFHLEAFRTMDGTLEPTVTPALDLAALGVAPHQVVRSRFDGSVAPRLLLVDADGGAVCAERNPGAAVLRVCPPP